MLLFSLFILGIDGEFTIVPGEQFCMLSYPEEKVEERFQKDVGESLKSIGSLL